MRDISNLQSHDAAFSAALAEARSIEYQPGRAMELARRQTENLATPRQAAASVTSMPQRRSNAQLELADPRVAGDVYDART